MCSFPEGRVNTQNTIKCMAVKVNHAECAKHLLKGPLWAAGALIFARTAKNDSQQKGSEK